MKKKITMDSLDKEIEKLQAIRKRMDEALKEEPSDFEEKIVKLYVEEQNVSRIAKGLNEKGFRLGNRKYIGKDITNIIKNSKSTKASILAKALFNYNNTLQNGKGYINDVYRSIQG